MRTFPETIFLFKTSDLAAFATKGFFCSSSKQQGPATGLKSRGDPDSLEPAMGSLCKFADSSAGTCCLLQTQRHDVPSGKLSKQTPFPSFPHGERRKPWLPDVINGGFKSNIMTDKRSIQESGSWSCMSKPVLPNSFEIMNYDDALQTVNGCMLSRNLLNCSCSRGGVPQTFK